jgi:hypothetical protein
MQDFDRKKWETMSQIRLTALSEILEEQFFREHDQELLEFLRSDTEQESIREKLSQLSGITDHRVLDELQRLGVTVESFTALMLLPLVRIAWADGWIQEDERLAILKAAKSEGIEERTPNFLLLERWLLERPEVKLYTAWEEYARAVTKELDMVSLETIKHRTLELARRIADTSGGMLGLGLGNRITKNEEMALLDLARAFER